MKKLYYSFFLVLLLLSQISRGAVTITTATGGSAISADNTGSTYTSLSGPVISESVSGEIGTGTLILNAPSGCIFDVGGTTPTVLMNRVTGNGGNNRNINSIADNSTIAITSITTSQISLTISSSSNSGVICKLTFQNIRVRPNTGAAGTGNITSSGTAAITGVTSGSTNFGTLTVIPGALSKLQVLVPGETASPGSASGKTGTPSSQSAGSVINLTVNAVDAHWNTVTNTTHTISISSTDANATLPSNADLVNGTKTFSTILKTAGTRTITASDVTDGSITSNTSPNITINPNSFSQLQLLLPGETASAGSATGKTGTPNAQTAGTAFTVTVNAVDDYYNIVSSTHTIGITSSDGNATLPSNAALIAGTKTFSVTLKTAGASLTLTATDVTDGTKTASVSPSFTLNAASYTKLQLLLPGETAAPGTVSGKTGTPDAQSFTRAFTITVNAVDAYWNVVSSVNDVVGITCTDATAILPSNTALVSGTKTFALTCNTGGTFTITASDISDGTKTANTSPSITIVLSILDAATGGSSVSADNKGGTYTTLTRPAFTEGTSGDAGVGTIILNAPTGFEFDVGGTAPTVLMTRVSGSGADSRNINGLADNSSIALTSVTTTQLTLTITSASNNGVACKLTWQNVRVRPSTGAAVSGNITKTGTSVLTGISGSTNWGTLTCIAGTFTKLQLLLPGETAAPGTASGKTGTPSPQTAASSFNVTANAVDANWNVVSSITHTVGITSSDANASLPSNSALINGIASLSVTLKTVGTATITASDITDGTKTANTSPSVTINAGAFSKLQILLPGETAAPGTTSGKTGSPSAQTAGSSFSVTVNAVDAAWNIVSSTHTVGISSSDANATLPANAALVSGSKTFAITLKTAGSSTITATDISDGTKTGSTSPSTTVNAGAFTKMQLLVPGETAAPGTTTGKTGTPNAASRGSAFTITVNAVDANWNIVSSTNTIGITSSDASATLPANSALVSGSKTFSITLNTAGSATITATNITDGTKTANTSPSISVVNAVITAATGGSSISADTKGGTYTSLTGPSYDEGLEGDLSAGTLILNAPSGVIFDVGGTAPTLLVTRLTGTGGSSRDINGVASGGTIAATSVTTTQITFNITSASNNGVKDRVTFQNIRVRPNSGAAGSGNLTITGSSVLTGVTSGSTNFGTLTVVPGSYTKLQLLLPGESAAPGTSSGKTGTPSAQTAGTSFSVTVNAVDANWNIVSSVTNTAGITSSDTYATLPANAALVSGTKTFSVTLKTAGSKTITATDITDGTKTANTSPATTINAGAFAKMQILLPGETAAPGSSTGKSGTASSQTSGSAFSVTVNAVDANWNLVNTITHTVGITSSSDANATLPSNAALVAGTKTFSITLKTAGSQTVTAGDISDGTKTANTSSSFTVNSGSLSKLQILLPGETAVPGSSTGKTGSPSGQTPGTAFTVTVNAVDANWNKVSSTTHTVGITSSDGTATLPSNSALVSGTKTFNVTFNNSGTFTVTATDITNGTITSNTSTSVYCGPITWTGGAGTTNWGDANNWSPSGVPSSTNDINITTASTIDINVAATCRNLTLNNSSLTLTILSGKSLAVTGNLTLTSGTLSTQNTFPTVSGTISLNSTFSYSGSGAQNVTATSYKNLTLSNSGIKTFAAGTTNISGNLTLSGSATADLTTNNTTLNFNGSSAQAISGTLTYQNLTINNTAGVSLSSGTHNITGTLTLTSGNLTTNGRSLILVSNSSGTARIDGSGTGTITGTVTAQRYISGAAGYRYIGSPLSNSTLAELQPDIRLDGFTGVTSPGQSSYWPNVYSYNESITGVFANGWKAPTNVTDVMTPGKGFAVNIYSSSTFPVTISIDGTVSRGSKSLPVSYRNNGDADQGWNLVANPFPSTIDWESAGWTRTNIQGNTYYCWNDAAQNYATYSVGGASLNSGTRYIPSGQGFFVRTNGTSPVLSATESVKVSNSPTPVFWKTNTYDNILSFKFNLSGSTTKYTDETLVQFVKSASSGIDAMFDAYKFKSTNTAVPFISTVVDTSFMCINSLSELTKSVAIPIYVKAGTTGTYTIELKELKNLPPGSCVMLEDLTTKNSIDILKEPYSFLLTGSTVTAAPEKRFILKLSPPPVSISTLLKDCDPASQNKIALQATSTSVKTTISSSSGNVIKQLSGYLTDTITGLTAGKYYIQSTGGLNSCPVANDTIIIAPDPKQIQFSLVTSDPTCSNISGGSAMLSIPVNDMSLYEYRWSNGSTSSSINNLIPGIYSVKISDGNCIVSRTFELKTEPILTEVKASSDTAYLLSGGKIYFSTVSSATSYTWDFGDGSISFEKNPEHIFTGKGKFNVSLIVSKDMCEARHEMSITAIDKTTGIEEKRLENTEVFSYRGTLFLNFPSNMPQKELEIKIYSLAGTELFKAQLHTAYNSTINMKDFPAGIYIIMLNDSRFQLRKKVLNTP